MPKADFRVLSLAQWEDEVANNNMEMARSRCVGRLGSRLYSTWMQVGHLGRLALQELDLEGDF